MTVRPDAPPASSDVLPLPDSLLVPLLDAAADALVRMDAAERPAVLRPVGGFDRRGLQSNAARLQLRRALDVDAGFREYVVGRFVDKPEVTAALDSWDPAIALRCVEEAAERSDLPWLASALYAAHPPGWAFGAGVICAAFERERSEKERDDDAKARDLQLASLDEACRRAETSRERAESQVAQLEDELREERRSRRERELRAERAVEDEVRRRHDAEVAAEQSRGAANEATERLEREAARARGAEQRLRAVQRDAKEREAATATPPAVLAGPEVAALAAATEEARRLTTVLEGLTRRARDVSPPARAGRPARANASSDRAAVPCPPGMRADSPDALDAMLRTRGVVLVVDGYNVSMAGWGGAEPAVQREGLVAALARLHLRLRCDVVVVFDGADVGGVSPTRQLGVRVVFSAAGEEADPVVVREVSELPERVPVVVASSDQWVHEHAEAEGAMVVPAAALLGVLRK